MLFTRYRSSLKRSIFVWICFSILFLLQAKAQTVNPWLTKGDQSQLIASQASVDFSSSSGNSFATISLDASQTFQSIEGMGFMLTQGSAEVIRNLPPHKKDSLLIELFHPTNGLGISMLRISIGASDLSNSTYTYNETAGDVNMNNFSLTGPDLTYLIPLLKDILLINSSIKILATPWTAPTWMKTNGAYKGGSLLPTYYDAYARYFVEYLQAMNTQNISIWGITPQNEPENPNNTPSMLMSAAEQTDFINNHLGPALAASAFSPKIIVFDHNCDNPNYPISVLNNSSYAEGAAFHLYDPGANIAAMTQVRNATGKDVYFTEQFTEVGGNFSNDLSWHTRNVVIGSLNNWSRSILEWNLATDENYGPRTPGGCTDCLGALTIDNNANITRNVSYYIIGQLARFAQAGAVRFSSSSSSGQIHCTALQNPDNTKVLLVYNERNSNTSVKVVEGSQSFVYTIPRKSTMTFTWTGAGGGPSGPSYAFYNVLARHSGKGLDVQNTSFSNGANVQQYEINNGGADNQRWRFEDAGSGSMYIRVKHTDMCLSATNNQKKDGLNVVQKSCNGANNQKWTITDLGNGYHSIINLHSNRALDVADVSIANGANVQLWTYFASPNQQWQFVQVEGPANKTSPFSQQLSYPALTPYPNPVKESVNFSLPANTTIGMVKLLSLDGKRLLISPTQANNQLHVPVQHLPSGMYLLQIELDGKIITCKIAKQ